MIIRAFVYADTKKEQSNMADKNIKVCSGVDIDAAAGWMGCSTR